MSSYYPAPKFYLGAVLSNTDTILGVIITHEVF